MDLGGLESAICKMKTSEKNAFDVNSKVRFITLVQWVFLH